MTANFNKIAYNHKNIKVQPHFGGALYVCFYHITSPQSLVLNDCLR